jgi:Fe2+ transport system protein FeoA
LEKLARWAILLATRRARMDKKYIVRLTDQERDELATVIKKLKGTSEKVRRAHILLKADADGPNWTDRRIAEAFDCRTKTVENVRQRLVEFGFRDALDRSRRETPPVEKLLDGDQEARIIATRLGSPPSGYANWTLRLLARKVVELGIVESVSYETVRRTLKKTG